MQLGPMCGSERALCFRSFEEFRRLRISCVVPKGVTDTQGRSQSSRKLIVYWDKAIGVTKKVQGANLSLIATLMSTNNLRTEIHEVRDVRG